MQLGKFLLASFVAALFGAHAIAAEQATASVSGTKSPAVHTTAHQHKKDCVEKDGKPCHLHKHGDAVHTRTHGGADGNSLPIISPPAK
jgi:hypothetical protein